MEVDVVETSVSGCPCVPTLTPPEDRVEQLRVQLAAETEPLVSLTHLLRLCREEHSTLWEHHADQRNRGLVRRRAATVADELAPVGSSSTLSARARRALAAAISTEQGVPAVVMAHAVAELLDERYGHSFTEWFRQRSPYQPAVGDPIPLDAPDLRTITALRTTSPPWRLANRLDETRRVRLAGAWTTQFRVVFDYSAFDALAGVIGADTTIATCHPNRALSELTLPEDRARPVFPVGPCDVDSQRALLEDLLGLAVDAGADIVILPELAVTSKLAVDLADWVRRPGRLRLLVAGSYHEAAPADPERRTNRALGWVRDYPGPLVHEKHSPADHPVIEDITPTGRPELRIHVTADGWHLVIAICRDLLNPNAVHALSEAGVNVVLAPAMSETLVAFGGPVAQLVGAGQAIVAVANNPADWTDSTTAAVPLAPARALYGHPGFAQQTRQVTAPDPRPGITLLQVRDGHLTWQALHEPAPEPPDLGAASTAPPMWLSPRPAQTSGATSGQGTLTLRPAAVLALLIDGDPGPNVLLTRRAPELSSYAEQLVFPGGQAEAGDRGPIDTALREAGEEVGLDRSSVHVLETLPSFALPETGFMVTPVVAWSAAPRFTHPPNAAEVTTMVTVPLADAAGPNLPGANGAVIGAMTAAVLDLLRVRLPPQRAETTVSSGEA